jgi:hypothetical protein
VREVLRAQEAEEENRAAEVPLVGMVVPEKTESVANKDRKVTEVAPDPKDARVLEVEKVKKATPDVLDATENVGEASVDPQVVLVRKDRKGTEVAPDLKDALDQGGSLGAKVLPDEMASVGRASVVPPDALGLGENPGARDHKDVPD